MSRAEEVAFVVFVQIHFARYLISWGFIRSTRVYHLVFGIINNYFAVWANQGLSRNHH